MDDVQAEVVEEEENKRKSYGTRARQMPDKAPCRREQAERIYQILRECGVSSKEEAEAVMFAHTGAHGLTDPTHISALDADNLLANEDFLRRRTTQALDEYRKQQEPEEEPAEVIEPDPEAEADTDVKDGE